MKHLNSSIPTFSQTSPVNLAWREGTELLHHLEMDPPVGQKSIFKSHSKSPQAAFHPISHPYPLIPASPPSPRHSWPLLLFFTVQGWNFSSRSLLMNRWSLVMYLCKLSLLYIFKDIFLFFFLHLCNYEYVHWHLNSKKPVENEMCFKLGSTWALLFLNSSHCGSGWFNNCSEPRAASVVLLPGLGSAQPVSRYPVTFPFNDTARQLKINTVLNRQCNPSEGNCSPTRGFLCGVGLLVVLFCCSFSSPRSDSPMTWRNPKAVALLR